MARFSDIFLRWAYFVTGLGSSALIATGLILWSVKRRSGRHIPNRWDLFVERLNAGMIVGLPIAMCAFFHANQLLPVELGARPLAEVRLFFAVWIAMALLSAILPRQRSWVVLTALLAVVAIALSLVNALTTDRGFAHSLRQGDWLMAGFDISFLAGEVLAGALS